MLSGLRASSLALRGHDGDGARAAVEHRGLWVAVRISSRHLRHHIVQALEQLRRREGGYADEAEEVGSPLRQTHALFSKLPCSCRWTERLM